MHLCAGLTAASWILDPFGEFGANFSLQLSSRTQFAKISNKKVTAENQCEKHKNWSLVSTADETGFSVTLSETLEDRLCRVEVQIISMLYPTESLN